MSRTWLIDVLDRELPELVGAARDHLADRILDALPMQQIGLAIKEAAAHQLRPYVESDDRDCIAADLAGNAAMAVVGTLGDADIDEDISNTSAVALEGDRP